MYYESILHTRRPVANAEEAAKVIHDREVRDYDAIVWQTERGELCCVADGGINGVNSPWGEVAVINLTTNVQIESITFAWLPTLDEKIQHLKECETTSFQMGGPANCPVDGEGLDRKAWFRCGCCAEDFESTIRIQAKYDQDAGFGICPGCKHYYA